MPKCHGEIDGEGELYLSCTAKSIVFEGPTLALSQGWQRTDAPPNDNQSWIETPPPHIEIRAFFRLKMQRDM